jgi:D-erythro-7,8-dihydroneopterin triphosphate epimerase
MAEPALDQIHIRDLQLRCIIGTLPDERREKQDVNFNITMYADLTRSGQTDDLGDTVDYKAVKKDVIAMVEASSFRLLERLAQRAAEICLCHARVQGVRVTVEKPGALRFARTVAVEIVRWRT